MVLSKKAQETTFLTLRGSRNVAKHDDDLIIVLSTLCFLHMPPLAIKYIVMQAVIDAAYIIRHVKKRLEYPAPSSLSCYFFPSFLNSHLLHTYTPTGIEIYFSPPHAQEPPQRNPWGHWAFLRHLKVAFVFCCHCCSREYLVLARCDNTYGGGGGGG